jgi:hypothetical protein
MKAAWKRAIAARLEAVRRLAAFTGDTGSRLRKRVNPGG